MYEIDKNGFVQQYNEGGNHSVQAKPTRYTSKKNTAIVHNHPNGSNLSGQDLKMLAKNDYKSIYAVGNHYTYSVTKGTHFKKDGFEKAIKKAKASTTNYNTSVDKWLKDNQKKYGYVYKRERTKTKK